MAPPQESLVSVEAPDRMNLLGLMLASVLARRLAVPEAARHARCLAGDVIIDAEGMWVMLHFENGTVSIRRSSPERRIAHLSGTLTALLDAALGRNRIRHFLGGRLSARGRPMALWHLLALVRA
jgi:hypothetical protein